MMTGGLFLVALNTVTIHAHFCLTKHDKFLMYKKSNTRTHDRSHGLCVNKKLVIATFLRMFFSLVVQL